MVPTQDQDGEIAEFVPDSPHPAEVYTISSEDDESPSVVPDSGKRKKTRTMPPLDVVWTAKMVFTTSEESEGEEAEAEGAIPTPPPLVTTAAPLVTTPLIAKPNHWCHQHWGNWSKHWGKRRGQCQG